MVDGGERSEGKPEVSTVKREGEKKKGEKKERRRGGGEKVCIGI